MPHHDLTATRQRLDPHDRRREIMQAVRDLCAERGASLLSVTAIAQRVGCTRSLFYHYFPTKEAAIDAALEETIDAFIEQLHAWNNRRRPGDIEGALKDLAALFLRIVTTDTDLPVSLVGENASLYTAYIHRVAHRAASYICESAVADFARVHPMPIDHVYETFYVLICGLIMYARSHPDCSEEVLRDIIASTLHIEGYTEKHRDCRPAKKRRAAE